MENAEISNHADLVLHITNLRIEKLKQEEELEITFREFVCSIDPISMAKASLHKLAHDKEVQFDLVKLGLNTGTSLLIKKLLGKYKSIKGFLSSILAEIIARSFINNNVSEIISAFSKGENENPEKKPTDA